MRFYLLKDKDVEFTRPNPQLSPYRRFEVVGGNRIYLRLSQARDPTPKSCRLKETVLSLIPMMSEQKNGKGFWNMKTVEQCGSLLLDKLVQSSTNCNRLEAVVSLTCSIQEGIVYFSVSIRQCDLLKDIFKACGEEAKLILEMYFKMPFTGEATLAGLVTPEMKITVEKGTFICEAPDFPVTEAMAAFWKKNTCAFGTSIRCIPRIFASCNLVLIVSDDLPLFQKVRSSDTNRRLLEEAIHSDFEIITSDNHVIKCHKSFLAVHSPVLERMLESDMSEASNNRMKVEDIDKYVGVAFLQYLYCKDLPTDDLSLALQLLKVAHKYEVEPLEQATLTLLFQKQDVYFTAEFASEVYVFVRNIPNGNDLKNKMMKIIFSERAVLNGKPRKTMRRTRSSTCDVSTESELIQWIFENYGERLGLK